MLGQRRDELGRTVAEPRIQLGPALTRVSFGEPWVACEIQSNEDLSVYRYVWDEEVDGQPMRIFRNMLTTKRFAQHAG
jgi:hypothetical protein